MTSFTMSTKSGSADPAKVPETFDMASFSSSVDVSRSPFLPLIFENDSPGSTKHKKPDQKHGVAEGQTEGLYHQKALRFLPLKPVLFSNLASIWPY